jgi:hypothetical protein
VLGGPERVQEELAAVETVVPPAVAQVELKTPVAAVAEVVDQTTVRQAVKVLSLLNGDFNNGLLC